MSTLRERLALIHSLPFEQKWNFAVMMLKNFVRNQWTNHPLRSVFLLAVAIYQLKKAFKPLKPVEGKIVLITGGAMGLGKNLARRFVKLGCRVVLWDINEEQLRATEQELQQIGTVSTYKVNLADKNSIYQAAALVKREVGDVHFLFNNAGIVSGDWITNVPDCKIELTFAVNVLAHFWTVKAFLPAMLDRNEGHIITTASAAGTSGLAKMVDYCASKFAAVGFDESLRLELAARGATGVKTTCVCPSYINTGMFDGVKMRFPLLLDFLEENYVCEQIVRAMRQDQAVLKLPNLIYSRPLFDLLLPTAWMDALNIFLGINSSMDNFKGRNPSPTPAPSQIA